MVSGKNAYDLDVSSSFLISDKTNMKVNPQNQENIDSDSMFMSSVITTQNNVHQKLADSKNLARKRNQ